MERKPKLIEASDWEKARRAVLRNEIPYDLYIRLYSGGIVNWEDWETMFNLKLKKERREERSDLDERET